MRWRTNAGVVTSVSSPARMARATATTKKGFPPVSRRTLLASSASTSWLGRASASTASTAAPLSALGWMGGDVAASRR